MTTYAVTASTGRFGQQALKQLVTKVASSDVVALARNVEKAKKLVPAGVTIRQADYDHPEQLAAALKGVDRLLFISSQPGGPVSRQQQHANVIAAAEVDGVSYITYTSFPHADTSKAALAIDHKYTEEAIASAGIQHSFLRNNWYLENELPRLQAAANGGDFLYAGGDAQVGWALEREYAEAAADVLASTSTKDVYEFAGKARSYHDLAAGISGDFAIKNVDDAAYQAALVANGLSAKLAGIIAGGQKMIRDGVLSERTTALIDVLGHSLTPLPDAIAEVLKK
ncbi:NAD(P)H-binding protein [Secundilactobacillus silagei]|uniref:NAD(P)-binding domain-containing protein n=1 Tax=Secundilactobacillus silagei JCM 19001 TaxID=1302250 RepID=A0A1Z5IF52_9LACO|nr:NAD(P)H-binding protein [Secundilactobacillus silagei]TDG71631.1 hypothetical protein C5L25_002288 [Secundilactobacillus silagei JCM 19001]GAX00380.1 hypothetical protein IWT126_00394 [Secundilactobacillus silagei JCM 19001]